MTDELIPRCVAEYEAGDEVCDGAGENAMTPDERAPCPWRDRCVAFQHYLVRKDADRDDFIEEVIIPAEPGRPERHVARPRRGFKWFNAVTTKLVERYGVENGRVSDAAFPAAPTASVKRAGRQVRTRAQKAAEKAIAAHKQQARERRNKLSQLFYRLSAQVADGVGGDLQMGKAVLPGQWYIVDRVERSGYLSLYARPAAGKARPIAVANLKPRTMTLDVGLPIGWDDFDVGRATKVKLSPRPIDDGSFRVMLCGISDRNVPLVIETVCRLIRRGKIELPRV